MLATFQTILPNLLEHSAGKGSPQVFINPNFSTAGNDTADDTMRLINAAFLIALCGEKHQTYNEALGYLQRMSQADEWKEIAGFYLEAIPAIEFEIASLSGQDPQTANRLERLARQLEERKNLNTQQLVELFWSFFHPQATGIWGFANSHLQLRYRQEREGWALYYKILLALEKGLQVGDPFADNLRWKARGMIKEMMV